MSDFHEISVDSKKTLKKIADTLYQQAPISNGAILFVALFSFFILKNYSDSSMHFLWPAAMICSAVYRLYLWQKRGNSSAVLSDAYWITHYALGTTIVGCSWGSFFLLPYVNADTTLYGAMLMLFFGVTASSIPVLSASLLSLVGYTLPIIICFSISIYYLNSGIEHYLVATVLVYYTMLLLLARISNKHIIHFINLQFQNEALIDQLREEVVQRESLIKARTEQLEQSNQQILDSETQLKNVITGAELGYWDWNYQTGHYIVNNRWLELLGLSRSDIVNNVTDWDLRIHPDDKVRVMATVEEAIKKKKPYVADFRMKHKKGYWVWIQGAGSLIESDAFTHQPIRLCGTHQDISYRKSMEQELRHRATHDHLTGLFNRVELEQYFQKELSRSKRYQHELSIFMIDIDHFKEVNDTYGHLVGDHILKKYAAFLQNTIRTTDLVARYGGEEFVVILPETSIKEAEELAERLRVMTSNLNIELNEGTFNITISLGIATYPEHGQSYDTLLEHADLAMYRAKQDGRNCVRIWS